MDGLNDMSFELNVVNEILVEDIFVNYRLIGQSKIYHSGCYPKEFSFFVDGHVYGYDEVEIEIIALNGENPYALGILEDQDQGTFQ